METRIVQIEADVKQIKEALVAFQGEIRELRIELKAANQFSFQLDKQTSINQAEVKGELALIRAKLEHESSATEENVDALCSSLRSAHASIRGLQCGADLCRQEVRRLEGQVDALKYARH
jgi:hypothetical protein